MDSNNELINDQLLSSLKEDLDAVRLNDYHFSEEEKHEAMIQLERRLLAADRRRLWQKLAWAAIIALCIAGASVTTWKFRNYDKTETAQIVPRNLDMVLTTTDGHSLNLSEGGQLVCNEMGYLIIKGSGQTLTYKPSISNHSTASTEQCELRVPEGKRTSIELSDGSKIWVNSASTVLFPISFEGGERCIRVCGEAYLEVAHKEGQPFYVETDDMLVKVLGTKFGVTAYPSQSLSRVVLAEGRVEVALGDTAKYILTPGQMLTVQNRQATMADVEAYTYTSWKDGLLYFNGTTLDNVMAWLAKQYAVDITCSPTSRQLRLYGKLVLEERLEDVLENLMVIEPITYEVHNNHVYIESRP